MLLVDAKKKCNRFGKGGKKGESSPGTTETTRSFRRKQLFNRAEKLAVEKKGKGLRPADGERVVNGKCGDLFNVAESKKKLTCWKKEEKGRCIRIVRGGWYGERKKLPFSVERQKNTGKRKADLRRAKKTACLIIPRWKGGLCWR